MNRIEIKQGLAHLSAPQKLPAVPVLLIFMTGKTKSLLMLGISFSEALVILLIGFLLIGPKKMTDLTYQVGKWLSQIKQQLKTIKETQLDPLKDSVFYDPTIEMNKSLTDLQNSKLDPQSTEHPQTPHSPQ